MDLPGYIFNTDSVVFYYNRYFCKIQEKMMQSHEFMKKYAYLNKVEHEQVYGRFDFGLEPYSDENSFVSFIQNSGFNDWAKPRKLIVHQSYFDAGSTGCTMSCNSSFLGIVMGSRCFWSTFKNSILSFLSSMSSKKMTGRFFVV